MTDTSIAGATAITGDSMDGMEEVTIIALIAMVITVEEKRDTRVSMIRVTGVTDIAESTRTIAAITINRPFERNSVTCATPEKTCRQAAANYEATSRS
jgi:hypothetical protein